MYDDQQSAAKQYTAHLNILEADTYLQESSECSSQEVREQIMCLLELAGKQRQSAMPPSTSSRSNRKQLSIIALPSPSKYNRKKGPTRQKI